MSKGRLQEHGLVQLARPNKSNSSSPRAINPKYPLTRINITIEYWELR